MRKILRNAAFLAAAMVSLSAAAQGEAPVISNYGFTNLNFGTGCEDRQGYMNHYEEALVDGVLHVMWVTEGRLEDGWKRIYEAWYRRSDDLGKTWSAPVCVCDNVCNFNREEDKMMSVVGDKVHIVVRDMATHLWHYCSQPDGTFAGKDLTPGEHNIDMHRVYAVGKKVAIAYYEYAAHNTHYIYSEDGENFTGGTVVLDDTHYANQCFLKDFTFDGERMVILYGHGDYVDVMVSDDFGRNWNQTRMTPIFKNEEGKDYCKGGTLNWWRNGSGAGHDVSQTVIDGEKIYTIFYTHMPQEGNPEQPTEESYVVLARSLDGGKTWLPLTKISDDFNGYDGYLAVRGDNVYAKFENNDYKKRGVWHSHDGGDTFELQNSWATELSNQFNLYANLGEIYVDDNDQTGQTAYFLFNDYGYAKTTDGFRTISEIHSNGNRYTGERFAHLHVDGEGRRHWFIEHEADGDSYVRFINYRREGDDPQPAAEDYALHLTASGNWNRMNYVSVPNTAETTYDREMTIEYWVKTGEERSFDIARSWSGGASGYEGWRTNLWYSDWYEKHAIEFKLRNYDDETVTLTSPNVEYNSWNHVACTYSASAGEARLYLNGQLAETQPMTGGLRIGRMPILIGGENPGDELTIDDFRVWNRPLSDAEVAANFAAKAAGTSFEGAKGLVLNYNFDQTLRDMSSSERHAIPVGTIHFVSPETAGIHNVSVAPVNGRTYDLQGREVAPDTKGIVIKDGHKRFN